MTPWNTWNTRVWGLHLGQELLRRLFLSGSLETHLIPFKYCHRPATLQCTLLRTARGPRPWSGSKQPVVCCSVLTRWFCEVDTGKVLYVDLPEIWCEVCRMWITLWFFFLTFFTWDVHPRFGLTFFFYLIFYLLSLRQYHILISIIVKDLMPHDQKKK